MIPSVGFGWRLTLVGGWFVESSRIVLVMVSTENLLKVGTFEETDCLLRPSVRRNQVGVGL